MTNLFKQPWRLTHTVVRGKGGRELKKFRRIHPAVDDDTGSESWVGSVIRARQASPEHPNMGCAETILPDGNRMYLFEAINLDPLAALGEQHYRRHRCGLGVLVKYLDAQFKYPLQVHPTRSRAQEVFASNFGKEESWYVIGLREDAPEPPYILAGFKEGVSLRDMEQLYRLEDIAAMERLCHKIPITVGETYIIKAGAPHALGAGAFVVEVQEPCDITLVPVKQKVLAAQSKQYRFLDEPVYEERVLGTFIYEGYGYEETLKRCRIPPKTIREGDWGKEVYLIGPEQTGFFSFTRADVKSAVKIRATGFPQIVLALEGEGSLRFEGGSVPLRRGDEWFLPYDIPGAVLDGAVSVIFCHPEGAEQPFGFVQ
ncbi:MAG: class I mannose-6-phosphate isomerase [Spirochaetaceae bacterium]|jgi:mannose-6-phosphate isomerase|nr:class I mannose-6-phosphate isomerase [Spirochaetaceae bacterium]